VAEDGVPRKIAEKILAEAVDRNDALEVDLVEQDERMTLKSRFLALRHSEGGRRIVIEAPRQHGAIWPVRKGTVLAAYFKVSEDVYTMRVKVLDRDRFRLNPTTTLPCLIVTYPARVHKRQRRSCYRAVLPFSTPVDVRFEPLPDGQKTWSVRRKPRHRGRARDLSAAGIGLIWSPKEGVEVTSGQVLALHFKIPTFGQPIVMNGTIRHTRPMGDGSELLGVQFTDWQESIMTRRAVNEISKYVVQLEIEEIKRMRGQ